jgi:hypothetical protein
MKIDKEKVLKKEKEHQEKRKVWETAVKSLGVMTPVTVKESQDIAKIDNNMRGLNTVRADEETDLNDIFNSELGSDLDVTKELFTYKDINTKTELKEKEPELIAKIMALGDETQNFFLLDALINIKLHRVSLKRMGRKEFVQAVTGMDEAKKQGGVFEKMAGVLRNDK